MSDQKQHSPLEFPCHFPIKAIGYNSTDLEFLVLNTVREYAPETENSSLSSRTSSGGKYLSVTVRITAHSREQLEAIYRDLNALETVLWTL